MKKSVITSGLGLNTKLRYTIMHPPPPPPNDFQAILKKCNIYHVYKQRKPAFCGVLSGFMLFLMFHFFDKLHTCFLNALTLLPECVH